MTTRDLLEIAAHTTKELECQKCKFRDSWLEKEAVKLLKQKNKQLRKEKRDQAEQISKLKKINRRMFQAQQKKTTWLDSRAVEDLLYIAEKQDLKIMVQGRKGKPEFFEVVIISQEKRKKGEFPPQ